MMFCYVSFILCNIFNELYLYLIQIIYSRKILNKTLRNLKDNTFGFVQNLIFKHYFVILKHVKTYIKKNRNILIKNTQRDVTKVIES